MVVVYSGESSRPAPDLESDEPPLSPRALAALDRSEPFPLASDLMFPVIPRAPQLPLPDPEPTAEPRIPASARSTAPAIPSSIARQSGVPASAGVLERNTPRPAEPTLARASSRATLPLGSTELEVSSAYPRQTTQKAAHTVRRRQRRNIAILGSLGILASFIVLGLATGGRSAAKLSARVAQPAVLRTQAAPVSDTPVQVVPTPPLEPAMPHLVDARSNGTSRAPGAAAASVSRRKVALEVVPYDARVYHRGVALKGPPYSVQVPVTGPVALEVARPGYVTRRVALDGLESKVVVGLTRSRRPNAKRNQGTATSGAQRDGSIPVMSGL